MFILAISSLQTIRFNNILRQRNPLLVEKFSAASQVMNDIELQLPPLKLLQPIHSHYVTRSREFMVVHDHAYPLIVSNCCLHFAL